MNTDLRELLRSYGKPALIVMAEQRGLDPADRKKDDLVELLRDELFTSEAVTRALGKLSPLERLVLDRIHLGGGLVDSERLRHDLLREKEIDEPPAKRGRYQERMLYPKRNSRQFDDVVGRLTAFGLVFSTRGQFEAILDLTPGRELSIPPAVRRHLPPGELATAPFALPAGASPHEAAGERLLRDGYFFWSSLREAPVTLSARGLVPKRDLRRINDLLMQKEDLQDVSSEEDVSRFSFLRQTLQKVGWLRLDRGHLLAAPEAASDFRSAVFQRASRFFTAWLQGDYWNELLRLRNLYAGKVTIDLGRNRERRATELVIQARAFVVELLKGMPAEQWIALDDLCRRARLTNYGFLFPRRRGYNGVENPYNAYGNPLSWEFSIYAEAEGWDRIERRFIEALLREPLYWLGVTSLAFAGEQLVAFQITSLGAQLLGLREPPPAEEASPGRSQLIVQPNYQILVFEPVQEHVLAVLDRFAERVGTDQVFEYRLTRAAAYRAQQGGLSVAEITRFLEEESSKEVPQNVRYALVEWGQQYERISIHRGADLCQVEEPRLLDDLLADPASAALVVRRLSPTLALLRPGSRATLDAYLVERGHLPGLVRGDEPVPAAEIVVAPDGQVSFTVPLPNLFLLHRLRRFSEPAGDGQGRRLTRAVVAQAAAEGMTAEEMLEWLVAYSSQPLAGEAVAAIKAWSRHYGAANLLRPMLLQLESEEVLRELESDPTLVPYLQRFVLNGPVLRIDPAQAAAIVSRLRAKGVEVREEGNRGQLP